MARKQNPKADKVKRNAAYADQFKKKRAATPKRNSLAFDAFLGVAPRVPAAPGGFGGPREMFDAVCATCQVATTVPFRPTEGGRPVLCRGCFQRAA